MTLFQERFRVESTRLADWDYSSGGWYFVTLCTREKKCSLGDMVEGQIVLSDAGVIAEGEIKSISSQTRFHDHILRSNASVNAVRDYIDHNPQNWLLDPENPVRGAA